MSDINNHYHCLSPYLPLARLASHLIETWTTFIEERSAENSDVRITTQGNDSNSAHLVISMKTVKETLIDDGDDEDVWGLDIGEIHDTDDYKITPDRMSDMDWQLLTVAVTRHFRLAFPFLWLED